MRWRRHGERYVFVCPFVGPPALPACLSTHLPALAGRCVEADETYLWVSLLPVCLLWNVLPLRVRETRRNRARWQVVLDIWSCVSGMRHAGDVDVDGYGASGSGSSCAAVGADLSEPEGRGHVGLKWCSCGRRKGVGLYQGLRRGRWPHPLPWRHTGCWGLGARLLDLSRTSTVERLRAMTQVRHRRTQGVVGFPTCHEDTPGVGGSGGRDVPLGGGMFAGSFWNFVDGERWGEGVDAGL